RSPPSGLTMQTTTSPISSRHFSRRALMLWSAPAPAIEASPRPTRANSDYPSCRNRGQSVFTALSLILDGTATLFVGARELLDHDRPDQRRCSILLFSLSLFL